MRIREKYEVMVEIPYKIVFILIFCYCEPCIFKILLGFVLLLLLGNSVKLEDQP